MSVTTEQVADELGQLSPDEFVTAVRDALGRTAGARRRYEVAVLLRTVLTEDERVVELSGAAQNVLDVNSVLADIAIRSEARSSVLDVEMLDSQGVALALGLKGRNLREAASDLRRKGVVVGVKDGQRYLYPAFQFDLDERQVWPVVAEVNQTLGAAGDAWAVASWWVSDNPRLGWRAPKELVGTEEQGDLLILAKAR